MATKSTGWSCTHSTSVVSESNTSKTIRVTCYWKNNGWTYDINHVSAWVYCGGSSYQVKNGGSVTATSSGTQSVSMGYHDFTISKGTSSQSVSCYAKITSNSSYVSGTKSSSASSVSVAAKPSYAVKYNANGGTGAPSNQTKWYGSNLTLSKSIPSRTGHTFVRWNTNTSNTGTGYAPGATYSSNAALTLYAIWSPHTYTVTYNANGGTGAPSNQTKTYGVNLTLSSTKPTKTNYNFLGWSTSANGGVVYKSGAAYTNNSAVTLYAVWELAYIKPRITNFTAQRCTEDGTANESGTYVKVTFDWATDYDLVSMYIDWTIGTDWDNRTSEKVITSGTSGSVSQIVGGGNISTETTYSVRGWAKDSGGSQYSSPLTIGTIKFPIDVKAGGTGVAFGKTAEKDNLLDVAWDAKFKGSVKAQNVNSYFTGVIGGASWIYIGDFTFDEQGQYAIVDCYLGDGQNGDHTQHTHMEILLKQGATNVDLPIGVTTNFIQNYANTSYIQVKFYHVSKTSGKLYLYSGFNYNDLTCIVNGSYKSFTPVLTSSTSAPETDKESAYYYNGGYTLYNNTSGTDGTVTLSQSISAFNYVEIFYCDNNNRDHGSVKVSAPNDKTVALYVIEPADNSTYIRRTRVTISGTTITPGNCGYISVTSANQWTNKYGTNYIKILKVVGYR